jgi:hypothetical protein
MMFHYYANANADSDDEHASIDVLYDEAAHLIAEQHTRNLHLIESGKFSASVHVIVTLNVEDTE